MKKLLTASALSFALLASPALAQEKDKLIEGAVLFELHANDNYTSKNRDNEYQENFLRSELATIINLPANFKIESNIVFEKINDQGAVPEDRSFDEGEGAFFEELKLRYEFADHFSVFAGKFNPLYGVAWDWGRGIYTHKLAEEYEQTQKIGFGATAEFEGNTLEVSAFHNDSKYLDETVIVKRDEASPGNDGAPGNTNNFESFAINLIGEDPFSVKGLNYHLGYLNLATDDFNANEPRGDQKGYLAGLGYVYEVNDNLTFDGLAEYNFFDNFEGNANAQRDFTTVNVVTNIYKNWNVTLGWSKFVDHVAETQNATTSLYTVSGGYEFLEGSALKGLKLEVGYKELNEPESISTKTVGFLARYVYEF